jgi:hypothetical protein
MVGSPKTLLHRLLRQDDPRQSRLWNDQRKPKHVWHTRFYDYSVWSEKKDAEKLRYMRRNPVMRWSGLGE